VKAIKPSIKGSEIARHSGATVSDVYEFVRSLERMTGTVLVHNRNYRLGGMRYHRDLLSEELMKILRILHGVEDEVEPEEDEEL
jgi:hypothetical protein